MERAGRIKAVGILVLSALALACMVCGPFHVARADAVRLLSGEELSGRVIEDTPERVVLEHDALGRLEIPRSQIKEVNIGPPEPGPREPALLIPGVRSQLDAGAAGAHGNAETFTSRAALKSECKVDDFRFKLAAAYYYGSDHDAITRNEYYYELFNEYFVGGGPGLIFAQGRYDWNAFEPWEGRVAASGGLGRLVAARPGFEIALRAGAGVRREYGPDDLGWGSEALANIELRWIISPREQLRFDNSFYYDFADPGQHRDLATLTYAARLDLMSGLLLKIGAENEYQFKVEPGFQRNDFKYFGALTLEF